MPAKKGQRPKQPRTKQTIVRKRERLGRVCTMIAAGEPSGEIQEVLSKEWGCTRKTIRNYLKICRTEIIPEWYEWGEQKAVASELILQLQSIGKAARKAKDWQAAVRAIRQQAELYGLNSARMIAQERDSLAMQLEQLRKSREASSEGSAEDAPRDQANTIRQVYGQRTFATQEDYDKWLAAMAPRHGDGNN